MYSAVRMYDTARYYYQYRIVHEHIHVCITSNTRKQDEVVLLIEVHKFAIFVMGASQTEVYVKFFCDDTGAREVFHYNTLCHSREDSGRWKTVFFFGFFNLHSDLHSDLLETSCGHR